MSKQRFSTDSLVITRAGYNNSYTIRATNGRNIACCFQDAVSSRTRFKFSCHPHLSDYPFDNGQSPGNTFLQSLLKKDLGCFPILVALN